jgi:sugar lactone lactonase YvrE
MKSKLVPSVCAVIFGVAACGDPPPPKAPETTAKASSDSASEVGSIAPASDPAAASAGTNIAQPPKDPPPPAKPAPALVFKGVGLATPESVLYDPTDDQYLATNINGAPLATDNNGFISQLSPDGTVKNLKWIEGGKNGVKLDAPKGTAIVADLLYVADITTVRIFDRKTGAPKGEVKIPGSTFLNDIAADAKGTVYVTDSGLKAGKAGFDPTGTDAVWSIDAKKKLTSVAKTKDLNRPNGILVAPDGKVWVNTFGAAEVFSLGPKGEKKDVMTLPKGSLDGLVLLPGGDMLVSSWESSTVYRGKPGGEFQALVTDVKSPADVGFDSKRSRIMIPLFQADEIQVWDVK